MNLTAEFKIMVDGVQTEVTTLIKNGFVIFKLNEQKIALSQATIEQLGRLLRDV